MITLLIYSIKAPPPLAPFWRLEISLFLYLELKYYSTLCLHSDQLPETLRESIYQTNPILIDIKKFFFIIIS